MQTHSTRNNNARAERVLYNLNVNSWLYAINRARSLASRAHKIVNAPNQEIFNPPTAALPFTRRRYAPRSRACNP